MHAPGPVLRIFSFAVLALLLTAVDAVAAGPNRDPRTYIDAADTPGSPLDLRAVSFGQRGTELVLRFRTAGDWEPMNLAPAGHALCVQIFYGRLTTPRARLCIIDRGENRPALAYSRLDPFGVSVENRVVSASLTRYDKHSFTAAFEPSSANLGQGPFRWSAESTWSCAAPAPSCGDRAPDSGTYSSRVQPLAEPRCFGAASRNPRHRCSNSALRLAVLPTPADALLQPNARCSIFSLKMPYTCQFGVRAAVANRTVALVGDSHAAHWRGALEVVAQARGWRGFSLTRSGCPLSAALPDLEKARRQSCSDWRRSVRRWFSQHPEVRTVFVSQLSGVDVRAPKGVNRREHQVRGFIRAWRGLPRSVRQIIVLRDVPFSSANTPICVERAMRARRRAGPACAIPRSKALRRDPAAIAARRPNTSRVHVIDLTAAMCSPRLCFPVVGGVLVHKDKTHITSLFAGTLGPLLAGRVDRLL